MARLNRKQIVLEVGETLRSQAKRLAVLNEQFSGDARKRERGQILNTLVPLSQRLQQVVDNCRAADGSYPNYPSIRRAIADGGEQVYELKAKLDEFVRRYMGPEEDTSQSFAAPLAELGQHLKLIQFAPLLERKEKADV